MESNYRFKVNLGGMIDILSNHLYSSPDVFVRELLQNGVDAIKAREISDNSWDSGKIVVSIIENLNSKTIIFEDNGIGLTEEEIHKFLAIIGESSKKDLISGRIDADYIGRFGIGLLSCFMVSDEINLITHSIKDKNSYHWIGKPDGTYIINVLNENVSFGTTIYLRCKKGSEAYYNYEKLENLIKYYGLILPVQIFLNKDGQDKKVNQDIPFWNCRSLSREDVLSFGQEIFNEKFIDYIPLEAKSGQVNGIAYIINHKTAVNVKNSHRIYLKNMLLSEKGDNILPSWAFFVKCVVNTNLLRPTASRENFYEDDLLDKSRNELGESIKNYFSKIALSDPKKLSKIVEIHDLAIKSLAVDDDNLCKIFFDYLLFQTSQGDKTGYDLRTQYNKIQYTTSVDKYKQMLPIFTAQNKLLVNGGYTYTEELLNKLQTLYNGISVEIINTIDLIEMMEDLDYKEEEECYNLIKTANIVLNKFECEAEIKHFKPYELPALYVVDTNAVIYRNLIENFEQSSSSFANILEGFINEYKGNSYSKICFNFDNVLIKKLMSLTDIEALKNCIKLLYVQSLLLGNYPIMHSEMQVLNNGIMSLIKWGLNK